MIGVWRPQTWNNFCLQHFTFEVDTAPKKAFYSCLNENPAGIFHAHDMAQSAHTCSSELLGQGRFSQPKINWTISWSVWSDRRVLVNTYNIFIWILLYIVHAWNWLHFRFMKTLSHKFKGWSAKTKHYSRTKMKRTDHLWMICLVSTDLQNNMTRAVLI
jgi:hypothetical protein